MRSIRTARRASVLVAATAAMLLAGGLTTAQAVEPDWETGGYIPHGENCNGLPGNIGLIEGPQEWIYFDSQAPKIEMVSSVIRVGNTPAAASLGKLRVQQTCGGIFGSYAMITRQNDNKSYVWFQETPGTGGNFHDVTFDLRTDTSDDPTQKISQGELGVYTFDWAWGINRFEAFALNGARTDVTGFEEAEPSPYEAGSVLGDGTKSYALRDTAASAAKVSKKKVKKGKKVTVSSTVTVANGAGYTGLAGQKVSLQRKVKGSDEWKTIKSATTSSSGKVSIKDKPKKSASYRLDFAGTFAAPWNAPITSGEAKVTVKKAKKKAKKNSKKND
jgi:hypothetical protein